MLFVMLFVVFGMDGVSHSGHFSVESRVRIGGVFDNSLGAIGFVEGVGSLDVAMTITVFPGLFVVSGVVVLYSVFEFVGCGSLV